MGRRPALLAHAIHGVAALCLQDGQRRSLLHSQQPKRGGPHRGGKPGLGVGTVGDYSFLRPEGTGVITASCLCMAQERTGMQPGQELGVEC